MEFRRGLFRSQIPFGITRRPPDVLASEDIPANGHGGPVTMTSPTSKENLRQSLRQARDSYARGLDPAERAGLEAAAVCRLRAALGPGAGASYLATGGLERRRGGKGWGGTGEFWG